MVTAETRRARPVIAVLGVAVLFLGGPARAADDKDKDSPLRAELLKLNGLTTEDTQKAKLRALIKDKEHAKKLVAEAGKMLRDSKGKANPFNFNGGLVVARLAHFTKQYDVAEPFYEYLIGSATKIRSGEKMVTAYDGLIDLYWDMKRYALVVETCQKFIDDMGPDEYENAKPFVMERLIQGLAKDGKFDDALRFTNDLIDSSPEGEWYFLQTKGWVLREQGKLAAAIDAYNAALTKVDTTKTLKEEGKDRMKDRVRYILTGLHVDNKEVDKAAKHLQTLIKRNPESATFKNDLGFIWCDHDMNLEESEKLIREAIELDKKDKEKAKKEGLIDEVKPNAAYLDSLGWVLFKQKKYKEALDPLLQATKDEEDGQHLEIWDHLGDCYMALGQKKDAIAAWEKGLKCEDLSPRDAERRRKVSVKLKNARTD